MSKGSWSRGGIPDDLFLELIHTSLKAPIEVLPKGIRTDIIRNGSGTFY
ncbi:MAG: hypothetical protein NT096_00170 [Proteobacteria bacterium]|nr:hypothetical protein [Pseudomonadota bacterium]